MEQISPQKIKNLKIGIWILSIVIPVVVAILFGVKIEGYDTSFLPPIYATINGITAVVLIAAVQAIKNKKQKLHEKLMKVAIICSLLLLVGYVIYHMTCEPAPYGDKESTLFLVYIFLLVSHILLSITVIPLVLVTYLYAYIGNFERHRKLAKITAPIWLHVAVTGVIVYLMISPYYVS
jgi:putative membrane protein